MTGFPAALVPALAGFAAIAISTQSGVRTPATPADTPAVVEAPRFEVDPLWPKPLPHHWVLGSTVGVSVDARDHVWIIHRPETVEDTFKAAAVTPPVGICCTPAPPVLEFDPDGTLLNAWGGPGRGYDWPVSNHGITVDDKGNVWIGGNDNKDAHILKFSPTGSFLLQIGHPGARGGSNDPANLWRAAKVVVDPATNEAYVADGYGNHRVVVFDADTGAYKRHWGAYGEKPDDTDLGAYDPAAKPVRQFRTVHCAMVSNDGFVYVCDRVNDRIQVFRKDGTFVKEAFFETQTLRSGSVWDLAFSRDPEQAFLYLVDGVNEQVRVVRRSTLEVLTSFGDGGRQPGQFFGVHNIATDSKGNLYTTETYTGARLQRFLFKGLGPVPRHQGVAWPARADGPRNDLPQPYRTTRDWGALPPGMAWPAVTAVEPGPDGSIYVVERCFKNSCAGRSEPPILKYSPEGTLLASWGQGLFVFPHGATVDRQGNLWVTDAGGENGKGHQVFKFSPQGQVLMTLGRAGVSGSGPDLFDQPTDVVVAPNGDIFITDSHRNGLNNRVVKFTAAGKYVREWGRKGSGPGEFSEPHTIAMDSRGRLFVGDRENNRIQIFDQDGRYLDQWHQFGRPSGIVITPDDTMYVADSESGPDTGAHELMGILKGIRIGNARTGTVTAFIQDMEPTAPDHSGAEGVGVDAHGNVYGAVVRRQMLERHVRK
jgi:DNA-binding beta-propeller fold protein YncE